MYEGQGLFDRGEWGLTQSHVTPAISASEIILPVTFGPGIQSPEPGEFGIIHGEYCMPLDSEYLLDFNNEELWEHKLVLLKKMLCHWTLKHLGYSSGHSEAGCGHGHRCACQAGSHCQSPGLLIGS